MHPIVAENPGYAEIAIQKEKHEAAAGKFHERNRKAEADYKAAQEKYRAAVRQATLDGEDPPAPPAPAPVVGDPTVLWERKQQLKDAERRYLADNADLLIERLRARLDDVVTNEARPYVEQLALIAVEVRELAASVEEIRRAAGDRTQTIDHRKFGAADLTSAVLSGADLLTVPPAAGGLVVHGSFR